MLSRRPAGGKENRERKERTDDRSLFLNMWLISREFESVYRLE